MSGIRAGWLSIVAIVVLAGVLGGCETQRLQDERNALYSQNTELQSELNKTRAALEAAERDRGTSAEELERLRKEYADAQARADAAAAAAANHPMDTTPVSRAGGNEKAFNDLPGDVEVIHGKDRITLRVPGDVLFAPGKAELNSSAKATLAKVAKTLTTTEKGHPVVVEGYTDTDPIKKSKWKSNQELSEARAESVAKYLQQEGVSAKRITTRGFGSTKPRDTKAKSRRVEIVVMTSK